MCIRDSLGAGPIGAACAVCARALGMDVTLADINPSRREFVKHSFDFPVFHPGEKSEKKEMMDKTGREGYHLSCLLYTSKVNV